MSSATATRPTAMPPPPAERPAWRQQLETSIAEHPVICIAAAVTLGALVGWFVKRR